MAELADAQASGACCGNTVRVQVPFPALVLKDKAISAEVSELADEQD